jgi:hypothetical protein
VGVVAPPVVGDDAAGVAVPALEPDAVPFKQLVLPKLNKNTESIIIYIYHVPPD